MSHPIIDKILREGVQSVNVSMLSPELRLKLMTDAGNTLMHQNRYKEAAHAFALAGNKEQLREHGNWLLKQKRFAHAAYFLVHVQDEEQLRELAQICIAANELEAAKEIYSTLGDETMLLFMKENL
jgi:hypothetical protein